MVSIPLTIILQSLFISVCFMVMYFVTDCCIDILKLRSFALSKYKSLKIYLFSLDIIKYIFKDTKRILFFLFYISITVSALITILYLSYSIVINLIKLFNI